MSINNIMIRIAAIGQVAADEEDKGICLDRLQA